MPPATTPGIIARSEAIFKSPASREIRLATISTTWQNRPLCSDSRSGLRATLPSELFSDDPGALHHGTQFGECNFLRKVEAAAIGQNEDALGRNKFESFANTLGDDLRCFYFVCLDVNDADTQFELVRELLEQ